MNLIENQHYEIIPDRTDDKAWNVRVLSGPYTETVIKYGVVKFNGEDKDMTFNFDIIYTPDTELKKEDVDLQVFAGTMLHEIMTKDLKENNAN